VRKAYDERVRRCKRGDVRSAVGMINFLFRASRGFDPAVGVPPFAKAVSEVLGEDYPQRGAVCMRLRFRFDLSTTNEWRLGNPLQQELSIWDAGWHDGTGNLEATLDGFSQTQGSPHTGLITAWQQGTLLRWFGSAEMTVDGLQPLARPHPPPPPETCELPTDARAMTYRDGKGTLKVEIVPMLEMFDDRLQRLDQTGRLQVRFAEDGSMEKIYTCSVNGAQLNLGVYAVFKFIHQQRGDDGMFRQNRNDPRTIGRERWYELPLQGGTQDLTQAGAIVSPGLAPAASNTWSMAGLFNVSVIPPS
jgi:hypothetical protein